MSKTAKPAQAKTHTNKVIENARKSFESVTGKKAKNATTADIEIWLNSLRSMGRKATTCMTYLTYVKRIANITHVDAQGIARVESPKRVLSDAEIKQMLGVVSGFPYALLASMLLHGTSVLSLRWRDLTDPTLDISVAAKMILINEASRRGKDITPLLSFGRAYHWVNEIDREEIIFPVSTHRINRKLKAVAKRAGINWQRVNISAIKNTSRRLVAEYKTADRITQALGIKIAALPNVVLPGKHNAPRTVSQKSDPRLHGIGRRSQFMKSA